MEALVQRCRSDADVPLRLDTLHGDAVHLKLNHRLPLEPGGGEEPELNQCHVTWFKAANSMLPGGWEMQGDSSFYQWQCVGLACWFPSQFPASSEGWALQETDSRLAPPPHRHRSLIDPALLCIPINWTEGEAAVCRITSAGRHILLASFQSLNPTTINSAVPSFSLPFPFPSPLSSACDKGQLFRGDNS